MAVAMASYAILFILISPSVVRGRPVPESENAVDHAEFSRTGLNVTVFDCTSEKNQISQISLVDMIRCSNDSNNSTFPFISFHFILSLLLSIERQKQYKYIKLVPLVLFQNLATMWRHLY